jgi:NADH-quinone oxidoreductase subunit N
MNAPLIWIFTPLFLGLIALLLRKQGSMLLIALVGMSLILTWLAWQFPIDKVIELGSGSVKISSNLNILGRGLNIVDSDRPLISLVFFANSLWLIGAILARPGIFFAGISQIIIALIVAALSVDPFLYAAIFIALIVLVSVPLLSTPSTKVINGLLRYLNFQLFALPFILFVGWLLAGVEASPGSSILVLRAGILLALGLAFLLALFPFHSWLPMLAEEAHPYSYAFTVFFIPLFVSVLALGFFERFAWIRDLSQISFILVSIGGLIAALGGLWAASQSNMARQIGFIVVLQSALILSAIGISGAIGIEIIFAMALTKLFSFIACAIALSGLREASGGSLRISKLSRITRRHPLLMAMLLIGLANFAALPLTISFFPNILLLEQVWKISKLATVGFLVGQFSLALLFFRAFISLAAPIFSAPKIESEESLLGKLKDPLPPDVTSPLLWLFSQFIFVVLIVMSLFPQYFFMGITSMLSIFPQIVQ